MESGGNPLAVNVNGLAGRSRIRRRRPKRRLSRERYIARGYSVDLGLMQVNSRNLAALGTTIEQVLDPCTNIKAGAAILTANYAEAVRSRGEGQAALQAALSAYNTGSFYRGFANGYVARYYGPRRRPRPGRRRAAGDRDGRGREARGAATAAQSLHRRHASLCPGGHRVSLSSEGPRDAGGRCRAVRRPRRPAGARRGGGGRRRRGRKPRRVRGDRADRGRGVGRQRRPRGPTRPAMATDYVDQVAGAIIKQLKEGTAPWQKPWEPGERFMPYNPTTGNEYRGMNAVWLMSRAESRGFADARWMTYRQSQEQDAQVRKGEKGTPIQFWKWQGLEPVKDADGKPVLDPEGQPVRQMVRYERPRVMGAVVFNAEQIDGLPPAPARPVRPEWERHEPGRDDPGQRRGADPARAGRPRLLPAGRGRDHAARAQPVRDRRPLLCDRAARARARDRPSLAAGARPGAPVRVGGLRARGAAGRDRVADARRAARHRPRPRPARRLRGELDQGARERPARDFPRRGRRREDRQAGPLLRARPGARQPTIRKTLAASRRTPFPHHLARRSGRRR